MQNVQTEAIKFLSQMAERRLDSKIPLDQLGMYTTVVRSVSLNEGSDNSEKSIAILQHIELSVFDNYPALQNEIKGRLEILKIMK